MTSRKENIEAEQGSAAWFLPPPTTTMAAEHKSDIETLPLRQPPLPPPPVSLLVRKEYANEDLDPNQIPEHVC